MKLAVVPLPNETKCEVIPREGQVAPPVFFIGRAKQIGALSVLLLCAFALVGTTYFATSEVQSVTAAPSSRPAEISRRPLARSFDGSRPLKKGDLVILKSAPAPKVGQIAAIPKESVLLARGQSVEALYMAGENSYVVISEKDVRIARGDEIRAIIPPVLATAVY